MPTRRVVSLAAICMICLLAIPGGVGAQSGEMNAALRVRVFPHEVKIDSSYHGTRLFLFGVTPPGTDAILRVAGPAPTLTMNRYGRILGLIWMPVERFEVVGLPSFYAVLSSRPLEDILSVDDQRRLELDPKGIGLRQNVAMRDFSSHIAVSSELLDNYFDDIIELKRNQQHFIWEDNAVSVTGPDFEAVLNLPSDAIPGTYTVQVLAIRDKKVMATNNTTLFVHKIGLVNTLTIQAVDQPILTGLLAVILPVIAGLGIARLFGMRGGH